MEKKDAKSNIKHYLDKLNEVHSLFDSKQLNIGYDRLSNKKDVEHELLYFKQQDKEKKGIFVFSFPYYLKELEDQEFKGMLGQNSLNFKIYNAYNKLKAACECKKECQGVRVNDILAQISWGDNKSVNNPKILRRILSLSYYLGWDLKKDKDSFDPDFFLEIENSNFLTKPKQRFNLDVSIPIKETKNYILYINIKADIIFVFKNKDKFNKQDIEKDVIKALKDTFKIQNITIE